MLLKIKNHGNSFRTITSGELPTEGVTMVQSWEAYMWMNDCTKKIEIIEDHIADESKKVEEHIAEASKKIEKPKRKKK